MERFLNNAYQKEIEMRELTMSEIGFVSGAGSECPSGGAGNNFGGVTNPSSLGADLIGIYEGLVALTSHIMERLADSL